MDQAFRQELIKARSDQYKGELRLASVKNDTLYYKKMEDALKILADNFSLEQIELISQYADQVALAVIGYTFDSFADMLAARDIDEEEAAKED